ncbi:MAG: hypothetical protein M0Z46_16615 [Actinomycetota bacterium]|jgi:hypothetical protein|nr:hypothetical protein [Actinomycetota bacterium]
MDGEDTERAPVSLQLTRAQAGDLAELLATCLRDLSAEIADTTNPGYREKLKDRRDRLAQVGDELGGLLGTETPAAGAHPGPLEEEALGQLHPDA